MAKPKYRVLVLDTTNASNNNKVIPNGDDFDAVTVLQIPAGLVASLAFGDSLDFVPILAVGQTFRFVDACGNPYSANEGLLLRNNAIVGNLMLLVSLGAPAVAGA